MQRVKLRHVMLKEEDYSKDGTMDYNSIEAQLSHLKGKVLTVVDASIADERQCEAFKSLIHQQFREQTEWIYELCWGHPSRGSGEESVQPK